MSLTPHPVFAATVFVHVAAETVAVAAAAAAAAEAPLPFPFLAGDAPVVVADDVVAATATTLFFSAMLAADRIEMSLMNSSLQAPRVVVWTRGRMDG